MIHNIIFSLAVSLLITLVVEVSLAIILGVRLLKDILTVVLVNVITNPIVGYCAILISVFFGETFFILGLVVLELLAFYTEAVYYRRYLSFKRFNPYLLSLILNLSSIVAGICVNTLVSIL